MLIYFIKDFIKNKFVIRCRFTARAPHTRWITAMTPQNFALFKDEPPENLFHPFDTKTFAP